MPDTTAAPPAPHITIVANGPVHLNFCDHAPAAAPVRVVVAEPPPPAATEAAEAGGALFDAPAAGPAGRKASPRHPADRDRQVLAVLRNEGDATAAEVGAALKVKANTADGYLWRLYQRGKLIRRTGGHGPFSYALAAGDGVVPAGWQGFR